MKTRLVQDMIPPSSPTPSHGEGVALADLSKVEPRAQVDYRKLSFASKSDSVRRRRSVTRFALWGVGVALVCGLLGSGGWYVSQRGHGVAPATAAVVPRSTTPVPPADDAVSSHMMFVGDVFWGRAIETAAKSSGRGPANLFRGLTSADKAGYDAWIGDMECPVTDKDIPYRTQVDALVFNCRPEYAAEAAKWFDVMTLANNHTDNNGGLWGLEQTRTNLSSVGIQYFGTYDMTNEDDICEVVAVKAQSKQKGAVMVPIALCGFEYVGGVTRKLTQMEQMKKYAAVMPVIAMPHMGVEYRATAEPAKEETYRALIDNGADVVIGGHPHVVQNSEVYKGRLIAYSTGNFLFDQQILGRDTTETLGVGIKLTINDQAAIDTYTSVAEGCKKFKDDCVTILGAKLKARPVFAVSYDFQYFDESTGTPVRASAEVASLIKARATVDQLIGLDAEWRNE